MRFVLQKKQNISSKIALVTGGSRGLRKDMALRIAEKGFDVIITWRNNKEMDGKTVRQIEQSGRKAAAPRLDMSNFSSLNNFTEQVKFTLIE
jgi:NAD(P)-dependent dehydrogenase (short-subunit alcohol dehydrogenase family)